MREAFGNTFVFNFIIVFVIIFIFFFAGSLTYSKAFKVKNRIVDIIEKYEAYNQNAKDEITSTLSEMGYRVNFSNKGCPQRNGKDSLTVTNNGYRYCVYEYDTNKGKYYGVSAYMYFEFPIIGQSMEFPVYGETRILGILR